MKLFARFHSRQDKPEEHEIIPTQAEPTPPVSEPSNGSMLPMFVQ